VVDSASTVPFGPCGHVLAEQAKVAQELGDAAAATRLSAESAAALDDLDFVGSGRYRRN
jgi:hypothetical protein